MEGVWYGLVKTSPYFFEHSLTVGILRTENTNRRCSKAQKTGAMQRRFFASNGAEEKYEASGRLVRSERFGVTQCRRVETTVHIHDFARDAAGQIGTHERSGVADFVDRHIAA